MSIIKLVINKTLNFITFAFLFCTALNVLPTLSHGYHPEKEPNRMEPSRPLIRTKPVLESHSHSK